METLGKGKERKGRSEKSRSSINSDFEDFEDIWSAARVAVYFLSLSHEES